MAEPIRSPDRSLPAHGLDRGRNMLRPLLDAFPVGVIVVDALGRVLEANTAAERVLHARDGLRIDAGFLHASSAELTRRIRDLVRGAGATAPSGRACKTTALQLSRPSGARPLQLLVVPLESGEAGTPGAALFVTDPEVEPRLREERVRRLFDLTEAEARVATELALGANPGEIASRVGVQVNTVRCQLKQIYAKTGTRGQTDLVRLLLTGPSVLHLR